MQELIFHPDIQRDILKNTNIAFKNNPFRKPGDLKHLSGQKRINPSVTTMNSYKISPAFFDPCRRNFILLTVLQWTERNKQESLH